MGCGSSSGAQTTVAPAGLPARVTSFCSEAEETNSNKWNKLPAPTKVEIAELELPGAVVDLDTSSSTCCKDGTTSKLPDKELEDWKRVLCGRFEVRRSAFAGRGGFAVVRRGRDLEEKRPVAVKFYENTGEEGGVGVCPDVLRKFRHEVEILEKLHNTNTRDALYGSKICDADKEIPKDGSFTVPTGISREEYLGEIMQQMPLSGRDLFVDLLGYSKDPVTGKAGADEAGMCYLVEELGLQTLEQYVKDQREFNGALAQKEVREIFRSLTQIVAGLHACGLAHLDIKPPNVMRFRKGGGAKGTTWKLVDMDGVLIAGTMVDPDDIAVTPLYCPPEVAGAIAKNANQIQVSRKMDVWAAGMSVLDCILPQPLLQPRYKADPKSFWTWLAGDGCECSAWTWVPGPTKGSCETRSTSKSAAQDDLPSSASAGEQQEELHAPDLGVLRLPPEIDNFDHNIARLLGEKVFQRDPSKRCSILEVVKALDGL